MDKNYPRTVIYSERGLEPMEIAVRKLGSNWLKKGIC